MSTAVGHGLADPKTRGKPVSHANEGRRLFFFGFGVLFCLWAAWLSGIKGEEKDTRRARAERDSGQNSGARRVDRMSLPLFAGVLLSAWATGCLAGFWRMVGFKGHSIGGNAKPTFGILSVIPGRDLFSF